jgi:hypothetical protein
VLVKIICDRIPHAGELVPVFSGPLIELPYILPAEVTNVDCLLTTAPHTYDGKLIAGTNVFSGKAAILFGFVLPDEQAAAAAVKQVQTLNLGKLHGLNSPLFILRRSLGKDANGKPITEEISCWIDLRAKSVARKPKLPNDSFGPVIGRVLTNLEAINLASGQSESLPKSLAEQNRSAEKDFAACAWLERVGMDIAYLGDNQFYAMTRDLTTLKRDSWESFSPVLLAESLHDIGRDVGAKFGDSSPLNNPTNYTFGFKTRESRLGLLQIIGFTNHPPGVKLRYKLEQ